MERIVTYTITEMNNHKPIDLFLKSMGYSSQNIIALKKMPESILVNGTWEHVNFKLHTNDVLTIHVKETLSSLNIVPISLPLNIVYEDADILVINKTAHMPIHPSQNNYDNTLANAVMYYFNNQNIPYTFRCINRLDRDTTGLTILAKHMISAGILSAMVQKREIRREYLAIVEGIPNPSSGVIDAPIGRMPGSTIERFVDLANGEHAVTHYEVQSSTCDSSLSLVSLWLETGRTHQIRVHMKHIGHPLIGDFLYNPNMKFINRQALHSHRLSFMHPITKRFMEFTAPLPDDMLLFK
ncbi:MAG: RluA family pseudouridine synthase [Lachnospiraceae bacterium]|nr:RluA family pseudouridine synthase [Lachnospiraceae bacterium]